MIPTKCHPAQAEFRGDEAAADLCVRIGFYALDLFDMQESVDVPECRRQFWGDKGGGPPSGLYACKAEFHCVL